MSRCRRSNSTPLPEEEFIAAPPVFVPLVVEAPAMEPAPLSARPLPVVDRPLPQKAPLDWPLVALAVWLSGIVGLVAAWLIGYARFVARLPKPLPAETEWLDQWHELLLEEGRAGDVVLRVTENMGPLLCRLPRGYALLVPRTLWAELTGAQRRAILVHELAHLTRRDVWKSLAVRLLALPHWFNPVSWLAVRRFDEAAEWACDQAATGDEPTEYAKILMRLGELANSPLRFGSAMSRRPLAARIRRLLNHSRQEDTVMKKAALLALGLCLVTTAAVRVNLVAREPELLEPREFDPTAQATLRPKPKSRLPPRRI